MSEKTIKKNFSLSADFNRYVVKHPDTTVDLPKQACLVFEDTSDSYLSRVNRGLAKEIVRTGEKCFIAIKNGKGWRIAPATK